MINCWITCQKSCRSEIGLIRLLIEPISPGDMDLGAKGAGLMAPHHVNMNEWTEGHLAIFIHLALRVLVTQCSSAFQVRLRASFAFCTQQALHILYPQELLLMLLGFLALDVMLHWKVIRLQICCNPGVFLHHLPQWHRGGCSIF